MIDRSNFIKLHQAARIAGRLDFAHTLAMDWLSSWPGDLEVQLLLARVEIDQLRFEKAIERLTKIVNTDPEYVPAYDLLAGALQETGSHTRSRIFYACAEALRGNSPDPQQTPSWAINLSESIRALEKSDAQTAVATSQETLTADPNLPLPILIAVRSQLKAGMRPAAMALARSGYDRWPSCIAFRLLLAAELLAQGENDRGVSHLHQASSEDPLGLVAKRILGADHPYRSLWPANLYVELSRPIPAEVASVLGENKLGGASKEAEPEQEYVRHVEPSAIDTGIAEEEASSKDVDRQPAPQAAVCGEEKGSTLTEENNIPEPLSGEDFQGPDPGDRFMAEGPSAIDEFMEVEADFLRLAERVNARRQRADEDRRVPSYVVLTSRTRLIQNYGEDAFEQVDKRILSLVETIRRRPGWTAYRLYVDDPSTLEPFGLHPADPGNAWQIKLRLADFDQTLAQRSEMIGACLIVGADNIVPFHRLPNPVDDDDEIVLSDNPYATTDKNYFAPEWPVGRLPSEETPDLLLELLDITLKEHRISIQHVNFWIRLRLWLALRFDRFFRRKPRALGYTASIWRKASLAVYKTIGEPRSLLTSPPAEAENLPPSASRPLRLSYFNLHGLEDTPEWFGQRDPLMDQGPGPDFPIAFRPQDVIDSGNAPRVVFTEACYGANIQGKSIETALCLKFLSSGTRTVVGSTKISYGSVTPPLIAADLLGRYFWNQLNQRLPVGEALRRAKLMLAAEMHRRLGYLDGEDQKSLISFVLYGDPLYNPSLQIARPGQKVVVRRTTRPQRMKTVCALGREEISPEKLNASDFDRVKAIVSQYLPGMADANCRMHPQPFYGCDGKNHECPSHQIGIKRLVAGEETTRVFTFSKHVHDGNHRHAHFARLTLDPHGTVLKFSVSR